MSIKNYKFYSKKDVDEVWRDCFLRNLSLNGLSLSSIVPYPDVTSDAFDVGVLKKDSLLIDTNSGIVTGVDNILIQHISENGDEFEVDIKISEDRAKIYNEFFGRKYAREPPLLHFSRGRFYPSEEIVKPLVKYVVDVYNSRINFPDFEVINY